MKRPVRDGLITSCVLATMLVACNAILDNQPGTLVEPEDGAAPPQEQVPSAGGGTPAPPDASEGAPQTCPAGKQACFGACVSTSDPDFGCGDPECAPCAVDDGQAACQGRTCIVDRCDPGRGDCNATATDGCETDLSSATNCGGCNAACDATAPLCAPSGMTFKCTNGCTPDAPLKCGAECVDPLTSTSHCGGCDLPCPVVANATSTCVGGACAFTCKATFHACAGKCLAATDPAGCGPACTVCPVPAGGSATCVENVCGIGCTAPSHLCDGKCIEPTDPTGCGPACAVCPVPAGGEATCAENVCGIGCTAPNHACGGTCIEPTDPTACGPGCLVCPAPPHAQATCEAGACGFACAAGFGDCDAIAANGCETTIANDPLHCGQCGNSCDGPLCLAGVCLAVPPLL